MEFELKNGTDITDTVSLAISILIRYPEVSTINYNPVDKTIKFSFLISTNIDDAEFNTIQKLLMDSIDVYNMLEDRNVELVNITKQNIGDYTLLEIQRDIETLTQGEICVLVMSIHQSVQANIIIEKTSNINDEDNELQEELIESMLRSVKYSQTEKPLLAIREDGRVLVFNM